MSKLYFCVFLAIISVVLSDQVSITPENLSPTFNARSYLSLVNAFSGDYFITNGFTENNAKYLAIFKIDADGVLTNISRYDDIEQTGQYLNVFTNGKWFGSNTNIGVYLFKLGLDNQPLDTRYWRGIDQGVYWVNMLSDDTMIIYVATDFLFHIFRYDSTSDDWIETQSFDAGRVQIGNGLYHAFADDNYLVSVDIYNNFFVYSRASNGTYSMETTFTLDPQYLDPDYTLHFNGNDTVIIASSATYPGETSKGQLMFIIRNGATWSEDVTYEWILPSQIGYTGDNPLLGNNPFAAVDQDNLFFGAPYEGYVEPPEFKKRKVEQEQNFGKVLLVQRRNALNSGIGENRTWIPVANIDSGVNNYFGSSVMLLGKYIGITQCLTTEVSAYGDIPCQLWVLPQCFVKPIGLLCNNQHFDSCNGINFTMPFYEVNDPLCDFDPKVSTVFEGETYTITYFMSRQFVANETCEAVLDCIPPPLSPPVDAPVTTPTSTTTPVKPTSGSQALLCTVLYLVAALALLF